MQTYALTILNLLDDNDRYQNDVAALKRALATRSEFKVEKLFPEIFPEEKKEGLPEGDIAQDYDKVQWRSPKDAQAEWERLSAMLANNSGFITGDEAVETPGTGEIEWTDWQ